MPRGGVREIAYTSAQRAAIEARQRGHAPHGAGPGTGGAGGSADGTRPEQAVCGDIVPACICQTRVIEWDVRWSVPISRRAPSWDHDRRHEKTQTLMSASGSYRPPPYGTGRHREPPNNERDDRYTNTDHLYAAAHPAHVVACGKILDTTSTHHKVGFHVNKNLRHRVAVA